MNPCKRFIGSACFVLCVGLLPMHVAAAESHAARAKPAPTTSPAGVIWYDAQKLKLEGRGWADTEHFFDRLPDRAKGKVTGAVWGLSKNTAGMCVHFVTDADTIRARWTVTSAVLAMPHMPATGMSGLDLYIRGPQGRWQWTGAGRPKEATTEAVLAEGIPAGTHEYLLYLPLYNGVKSLEIGIGSGAVLKSAPARPEGRDNPICFYGTSVMQGGCASRPGMAHASIIGRMLDRAIINLGFSGSGKMEPEMAQLMAELDPAVFVLDCLPNMTADMVRERLAPFVEVLRKAHPATPIMLVENTMYDNGYTLPKARKVIEDKNVALQGVYKQLLDKNVSGLTYVPSEGLTGTDGEGTVDGCHPTDLGFHRFAEAMTPVLKKVLSE